MKEKKQRLSVNNQKRVLDKIFLTGLRFYGYHGVHPEEKKEGQWFVVDLELWGDFSRAAQGDKIEDALDYSRVYQKVKNVVEGPSVNLIERLARLIITELCTCDKIDHLLIRVKKPQAPLGGEIECAGVEMNWCKGQRGGR